MKMLSTHFAEKDFHIRAKVLAPGTFPSGMTSSWVRNLEKFEAVHGDKDAFEVAYIITKEKVAFERTGNEQDFVPV